MDNFISFGKNDQCCAVNIENSLSVTYHTFLTNINIFPLTSMRVNEESKGAFCLK